MTKVEFQKLPSSMHRYAAIIDGVAHEMKVGVACKTRKEAINLASCIALYSLMSSQSVYMRLPHPFRELWVSWIEEDAQEAAKIDAQASQEVDLFISSLASDIASSRLVRKGAKDAKLEGESASGKINDDRGAALISPRPSAIEAARIWRKRVDKSKDYSNMLIQRAELPAFQASDEVIDCIYRNSVTIVMGETGCGKSTQVPQLIISEMLPKLEEGERCHVLCTQPRRISATSLAARVSAEMADDNGPGSRDSICGYQIGGERRTSSITCVTYCTTGIVLKMLQGEESATLPWVTHVVVDEVHERSVQSDLLLALLKVLISTKRPDLKIILMSATVKPERYVEFFGAFCTGVLQIPGRTFPVECFHLEDALEMTGHVIEADRDDNEYDLDTLETEHLKVTSEMEALYAQGYSENTVKSLQRVDESRINYDLIYDILVHVARDKNAYTKGKSVLVFMPGMAEIEKLRSQLLGSYTFSDSSKFSIIALHSSISMTPADRDRLFRPRKDSSAMKIVISTNIAETGITIPDCVCVIDTALVKQTGYDEQRHMKKLETTFVGQASAEQRRGRAGRVMPGTCYRLISRRKFDSLYADVPPEILRIPLEEVVLQVLSTANVENPANFLCSRDHMLQPPSEQSVQRAITALQDLGAIEDVDGSVSLKPLGRHLVALPVDVRLGKMLVYASLLGCLDPILSVASAISYGSPFVVPIGKRDAADAARANLTFCDSDLLTIHSAFSKYESLASESKSKARAFCKKYFLKETAIRAVARGKRDLSRMLQSIGFPTNKYSNRNASKTKVVSSCLVAGLYPQVALALHENLVGSESAKLKYFVKSAGGGTTEVAIHPSSINHTAKLKLRKSDILTHKHHWLVFLDQVKTSRSYIRDTSVVHPCAILVFGGDIQVYHEAQRVVLISG